jgi:ATP-binding cassette subfamily A (ABC1) protein 3
MVYWAFANHSRFSAAVINFLSAAYLIGMIGIVYHLTGFQAMEREKGLSTLIEAMGGSKFARMMSYHIAFSIIYFAGWVVISFNMWGGIFNSSSPVILIIWHITSGWALASWALFMGSIFKKAQLSGITATVFSLGLGIAAQVSKDASTGAYAILSLTFPPMNYVFHSILMGRWEGKRTGASVIKGAPDGHSSLPIVALWIFSVVQAILYPIAAAYIERYLYGTTSPGHRHINSTTMAPGNAVELRGFTKRYPPRLLTKWFGRNVNKEPVVAVNNLDLNVLEGQIMVLLGANGSGKTTTLEAVAGLAGVKEGNINIATGGGGGIGICPQKNVLWDDLTVEEHVKIWSLIKCQGDNRETLRRLIEECDLTMKRHAKSKTLSGGQKRKLQLAAMFTGGSSVCAIDEVSSGLDPLSRRKIWDIILAARGVRTILMTSHFLDEADLLADHIAILSKGHLKCQGSAVQLKTEYGGGYRVHAPINAPEYSGVSMKRFYDQTIYNIPDAPAANRLIESLEKSEVTDYYVQGPTIEDVFLSVTEESIVNRPENVGENHPEKLAVTEGIDQISTCANSQNGETADKSAVNLHNGRRISLLHQTWVMIRKRITTLKRGYLPPIAAVVIPIVAAGITVITFEGFPGVTCNSATQVVIDDVQKFTFSVDYDVLLGPRDEFNAQRLLSLASVILPSTGTSDSSTSDMAADLANSINYVDSIEEFNQYIQDNYKNITPGGIFMENNNATISFKGNNADTILRFAMTLQTVVDNLLFNVAGGITAQYLPFDFIWPQGQGDTMIFITYASLAFAAFPAFFALYPTFERIVSRPEFAIVRMANLGTEEGEGSALLQWCSCFAALACLHTLRLFLCPSDFSRQYRHLCSGYKQLVRPWISFLGAGALRARSECPSLLHLPRHQEPTLRIRVCSGGPGDHVLNLPYRLHEHLHLCRTTGYRRDD